MQLQVIQKRIYEIRGKKVMLDFDLAELYETETKYLKRTVRQHISRFPPDFMFELEIKEWESLRCNFSTSKRGGTRYMPFAFTEHGVAMLASVLNSDKAALMNIAIVRAFIALKEFALTYKELAEKITKLELKYDKQFTDINEALDLLLDEKENNDDWNERKPIGY
jgi:hypothetical protein